jgi:hypothetical protein
VQTLEPWSPDTEMDPETVKLEGEKNHNLLGTEPLSSRYEPVTLMTHISTHKGKVVPVFN